MLDIQNRCPLSYSEREINMRARRKAKNKPLPQALLLMRVNGTALGVLDFIKDISFKDLSASLYFIAKDLQAEEFTRRYEAQIEYASVKPVEFADGLYKFFNDTAKYIKSNNLYSMFFEFEGFLSRYRVEIDDNESPKGRIINAYQALLMETREFLKQNKFDLRHVVVGQATDGRLLMLDDSHPLVDLPVHELEEYLEKHSYAEVQKKMGSTDKVVAHFFSKHGFEDIRTLSDMDAITQADRAQTHQLSMLGPYINEFTCDILPNPAKSCTLSLPILQLLKSKDIDIDSLHEMLMKRCRTLPANGMVYNLELSCKQYDFHELFIDSIMLKEIVSGGHMILLYKIMSRVYETSGYYDTKDAFFYSVLRETDDRSIHQTLEKLILTLYAGAVTKQGPSLLPNIKEHFHLTMPAVYPRAVVYFTATPVLQGGELRRNDVPSDKHRLLVNNENYEARLRTVQGFTRKVGEGRKPSNEAVERAKALGFELAPDETYVQSFTRQTYYRRV